eukprot:3218342-Prymnesium_polylepis.1
MAPKVLVSPQFTVHFIADQAALKAFCQGEKIMHLHSNLKQLCGWGKVGDDRHGRGVASGWTLLEKVKFLSCVGVDNLQPAVGSAPQVRLKIPGLADDTTDESVKKLLNGKSTRTGLKGRWTCINAGNKPLPAFVESLGEGDSLLGHKASSATA